MDIINIQQMVSLRQSSDSTTPQSSFLPSLSPLSLFNKQMIYSHFLDQLLLLYNNLPMDLDNNFLKAIRRGNRKKQLLQRENMQQAVRVLIAAKNKLVQTTQMQYYDQYNRHHDEKLMQNKSRERQKSKLQSKSELLKRKLVRSTSQSVSKTIIKRPLFEPLTKVQAPLQSDQNKGQILLPEIKLYLKGDKISKKVSKKTNLDNSIRENQQYQDSKMNFNLSISNLNGINSCRNSKHIQHLNQHYCNNKANSLNANFLQQTGIQKKRQDSKTLLQCYTLNQRLEIFAPRRYSILQSLKYHHSAVQINTPKQSFSSTYEESLEKNKRFMLRLLREKQKSRLL